METELPKFQGLGWRDGSVVNCLSFLPEVLSSFPNNNMVALYHLKPLLPSYGLQMYMHIEH